MDIKQRFGEKVKLFRLQKSWSQEKLALEARIDKTYRPNIEKGERNVSITVDEKLAIAFGIEVKDFLMTMYIRKEHR